MECLREHKTRKAILAGILFASFLAPGGASAQTGPLQVGALPVTCNLTLPIAGIAMAQDEKKAKTDVGPTVAFLKYSGWPEVKESLMAGRIKAAYMLAPLVMDLVDKGIPIKIVALGHRSGAVVMVRADSSIKSMKELKGKRVAIPSRFAVDYLFVKKLLKKFGMTEKDVDIVEMNPPDMPAALYAKSVDAYATGEPFGAVAQRAGYAVPLYMTRNDWPNYICCVLTVRDELIRENRLLVQRLVNYVLSAGRWLDASQANRTLAVEIAAGPAFFNQDPQVLKFVMENPSDRVTYGDLRLVKSDFEELMQLSLEAGTIKRRVPYEKYVDESFVRNAKPGPITVVQSKGGK